LKRRHSSIDPDRLLRSIEQIVDEFLGEIEKLEREQPDVFAEDKLRSRIDLLFSNRVGAPPASQEELDKIYQEGKSRYENRRPPGYEDVPKGKQSDKEAASYIHNGLLFRREYGDLILWHQTIQEAKARGWKQLILVTDDEKEDWWWVAESKGKKTIGPRPELIEEMLSEAGVTTFHMYKSEHFIEFAKKYLKAEVEPSSIEQVREVAEAQREVRRIRGELSRMTSTRLNSENAVLGWLRNTYPNDDIAVNDAGFPDFIRASSSDTSRIGYEVKYYGALPERPLDLYRLRDVANMGFWEMAKGNISSLTIVVVLEDDSKVIAEAERRLRNPQFEIPANVRFLVGKLIKGDDRTSYQFMPLFET